MSLYAAKNTKPSALLHLSVGCLVIVAAFTMVPGTAAALDDSAGTAIGATICSQGSTVSLSQPNSDAVVTDPSVQLIGEVSQSNQIEVQIDGAFDSIISLATGQTSFEGVVQLTAGTHTITLTAVDVCQTNNAQVSRVITYTAPPATSSNGSDAQTNINDAASPGGVVIGDPVTDGQAIAEASQGGLVPQLLIEPFNALFEWLNIQSTDSTGQPVSQLGLPRAFFMAAGAYLSVFSVATSAATNIAGWQALRSIPRGRRIRYVSRAARIIGVIIIIVALLLP